MAVLQETLTGLVDTYQTRFATEWANINLFALLRTGGSALFTFFGGLALSGTFILVLILIFAITMGQVVWAMIAISISHLPGPDVHSLHDGPPACPSSFGDGSGPSSRMPSTP